VTSPVRKDNSGGKETPGTIHIYDLETLSRLSRASPGKQGKAWKTNAAIRFLRASPDGRWLGAVNDGGVGIYDMRMPKSPKFFGFLPGTETQPVTAIGFHPDCTSVIATTADNQFFIYKLPILSLSDWTKDYTTSLPELSACRDKVTQVVFDPEHSSAMILVTSSAFFIIDLDFPPNPKKKQKNDSKDKNKGKDVSSKILIKCNRYRPLQYFEMIDKSTFVAVETPWLDVIKTLPTPVFRKKYGT